MTLGSCSVDKIAPLVESGLKCTNDIGFQILVIFVPDYEVSLFVNLKSHFIRSFIEENDFVNLVKLFKDYNVSFFLPWLQVRKQSNNKILVVLVLPSIERRLIWRILIVEAE
jgi:hypothetical protein